VTSSRVLTGADAVETAHSARIEGSWWLCAATADRTLDTRIASGGANFRILPDRRLEFQVTLTSPTGKTSEVRGIAAADANARGIFSWTGRGFVRLATWFRWSYRFAADDRLLMVGHPGSLISIPSALLLVRDGIDELEGQRLVDTNAAAIGLSLVQLRDLTRFSAPR
jgi:hypothetical protein